MFDRGVWGIMLIPLSVQYSLLRMNLRAQVCRFKCDTEGCTFEFILITTPHFKIKQN